MTCECIGCVAPAETTIVDGGRELAVCGEHVRGQRTLEVFCT